MIKQILDTLHHTGDHRGWCYFRFEIATIIGVKEAILLNHFIYWVNHNKKVKSRNHFRDGKYWTYLSMHDLSETFPFWNERQLRTIVDSLVKKNLVIKGDYGRKLYYKATWYSVPDELLIFPYYKKNSPKKESQLEG